MAAHATAGERAAVPGLAPRGGASPTAAATAGQFQPVAPLRLARAVGFPVAMAAHITVAVAGHEMPRAGST